MCARNADLALFLTQPTGRTLRLLSCLRRLGSVAAPQRDVAWTSAVLWIGQACHSGAMAPSQKAPQRAPADASLDDLYDYARAPARPGRRRAKSTSVTWTVTDDWPHDVPVTDAEVDMFEA